MALLPEAFTLGTAPPVLSVARVAPKPGRVSREAPERGGPSRLAAAATVLVASVAAKRRTPDTRMTATGMRARAEGQTNSHGAAVATDELWQRFADWVAARGGDMVCNSG
ncbi:cryS [Symbiodinium natans]|uniref:CryS protein n=1 Tax=Symbiodinium natans TaxID=878477 RepID=A0A812T445_9DINO|nr:cryS [Symbiodinium natans]